MLITLYHGCLLAGWFLVIDVNLGNLRKHLSGLSTVKSLFSLIPHCTVEGSHYVQPTRKKGTSMLYLLEDRAVTEIIWNSSAWEVCVSCFIEFIYSIIHLNQHRLANVHLIHWVIIQYYIIYLVTQIVPALGIGNSFSWILYGFTCPHWGGCVCVCMYLYVYIWTLPYFLALCSRFILHTSRSSPRISHISKKP